MRHTIPGRRAGLLVLALALAVLSGQAAAAAEGPEGWINAKTAFGLVGDGKADDSDGLQKAFGARGRPVFLPVGTYRFTRKLRARSRVKIYGATGGWNPQGQTVLLYDGPVGGVAVEARKAHWFQMRQVTVNGNAKAAIGVYWDYSGNEAGMQDVAIIGTTEHGLYVTATWYARFQRVVARNNLGSGITLDRSRFKKYARGPVNDVSFISCRGSSNGKDDRYDGEKVIDTGYGFGAFGGGTVVNLIGCSFENNGGAGVYLGGHLVNYTFQGSYIEHNGRSCARRAMKRYSQAELKEKKIGHYTLGNRPPTGRQAGIIEDLDAGQFSVVFDNCYVHNANGIWLKGKGTNNPVVFRNMVAPCVIWSEHGNWEIHDGSVRGPITTATGIVYRSAKGYKWTDPLRSPPSGHPGYFVTRGVRRVAPAPPAGLDLYVHTDRGSDRNHGRTAEKPWKTLSKAVGLYANTTPDAPVRIHLAGRAAAKLALSGVGGRGSMMIQCDGPAAIKSARLDGVTCRFEIRGGGKLTIRRLHAAASPNVWIKNAAFAGPLTGAGSSGIVVHDYRLARPAKPNETMISADGNSRIFMTTARVAAAKAVAAGANGGEVVIEPLGRPRPKE